VEYFKTEKNIKLQKDPEAHHTSNPNRCRGGGVSFLRDKWKECDVNHSSPCGVEVKNEWRYTSTPMCLDGVDRETFTFTF